MTSSDGFYSPPLWQTPDTSTVSSQNVSVPSGNEETGQPQAGVSQADKSCIWSQLPAERCSDERSIIYNKLVTPSPPASLQLPEAVLTQTQNCRTDPSLDVPGSQSSSQKHNTPPVTDNNPAELQDGLASESTRAHDTNKMLNVYPVLAGGLSMQTFLISTQLTETLDEHRGAGEYGKSVLLLHKAGTAGKPVQPVPDEDLIDSVEEKCQDPQFTSAGSVRNVCLQQRETVVCHTQDLHTASAVDVSDSSPSSEHNSGLVSSDRPNVPVQLQERLSSNSSPRIHSADETFSLDPVIAAGLSAHPPQGSRCVIDTPETLAGPDSEHGKSALLLSEKSDGEAIQPVSIAVTTVDSVEGNCQDLQSTSTTERPLQVPVQNVCSEWTKAVVCHTHDSHTASAHGVCGSASPSPERNSGTVYSDYTLVELQNGITSERSPRTHSGDMHSGLVPVISGVSETLAGDGCAERCCESAMLFSEGTEAVQVVPDEVTASDSVEEKRRQDCLFNSSDAVQDVCQSETLGSLSPSTLVDEYKQTAALSNAANSNEACLDNESLTKCVTHIDSHVATEATDTSAKEKQTWTGCSDRHLQNNRQHTHTSADSSESAGLPYSLRHRRRRAPYSSSADSSSAPVSAKRSCTGLVQSYSSISAPVEGCSQGAQSLLTVPVKRKRGRPRKAQPPVNLNEVSSTASLPAGKAASKSPVVKSTVTEDCVGETPDTSLSTRRSLRRKAAAASATRGETEGQGNIDCPPDPPLTLSTGTQQSQEGSQEPELAAPCSDLSLEQILQDDPMPLTPLSLPEEDEDEDEDPEDDEELPSILERKPLSITEGQCVWCKFRKYPFWPAVVKSVNQKNKKASIVFIDTFLIDEKGIRKGLTVSLKTLKPFDCGDAEELTEQARLQYGDAITWCLDLIYDYRIRIGCGSFSGSFIEYFANDISCPLRQKYSQGTSDLTFPTQLIVDDLCDSSEEDGAGEQVDEHQCKKVLPDRAKAARTRANEKLVDFIVRKRGAEKRLLAVISGQETSKWLRALQKASRFVVDPYLEEEDQVDQVYRYLDELLRKSPQTLPCLANLERIPFILDVLLPEALICAIAGVDDLSLEEAEEKYRKGPCISKRERQEFNMRIEQLMKTLNKCKHVL